MFGAYTTAPSATRYAYKGGNNHAKAHSAGGHYGKSSTMATTPTDQIDGVCTPCHDPHGVSPSLGAKQTFAVPLLKGSWVTSPYKEDVASNNKARGGGSSKGPAPSATAGGYPEYNLDQNTFQADATANKRFGVFATSALGASMQNYTGATSGGLCLRCHNKTAIAPNAGAAAGAWKSVGRIHNSVAGWAATSGTGNTLNKNHAYTCSKCHAPHSARLPRLMVTNCLNANHKGKVVSGGVIAAAQAANANGNPTYTATSGTGAGRFPIGGGRYTGSGRGSRTPGPWGFASTGTTAAISTTPLCHNVSTAGGATFRGYTTYKWNNKTQW
jgi:hypothetical protein